MNILELRNWVTSSEFDVEQGRFPRLNNEQSRFVETRTKSGYRRIKGPAGSGKSIVLAARAAKLQSWQNKRVLVLSFNITLLNFLRDQAVRYDRGATDAVFLHYHSWAKRICNEFGMSSQWANLFIGDENIEDRVFYKDVPKLVDKAIEQWRSQSPDSFPEQCFDAILVDEGQDFNLHWWNNLRQVLSADGEMVLVSDPTQDLYDTASAWTDEAMVGAGFSGPWSELKDCYRMPKDLHEKTNAFAQTFLPAAKERVLVEPREDDLVKEKVVLKWVQVKPEDQVSSMIDEILDLPKTAAKLGMVDLSYADIVFLTLDKLTGNQIKDHLTVKGFNISSVFAQDNKKNQQEKLHFYKGSGRMKGATIHSFKGLESRALVVNIPALDSTKNLSATYAALTRLKAMPEGSFLTVVCSDNNLAEYGETWKGQALYRKMNPIEEVSENQTGVTYTSLFADCLEGANVIDLTDPYIRMPHQFANLREFLKTCRIAQNSQKPIKFQLDTGKHSDQDRLSEEEQNLQFENITKFAKNLNIEFTWRRTNAHDRHIKTNHGWKIILGRGLDIFKSVRDNPKARHDYSLRECKEFKVTYSLMRS
ncbi:MIT C-terminal domain-containing protein [Alphaproteobacteria bacterium]|nr:MIT C-terminal domain-containing protein [Alphaproteobacteria bacterium]